MQKGRDQRPAIDAMLKDAVRRRFDILMVWSIDRLGRSVLHVANALAELDAAGIRLYCDREGIGSSTPVVAGQLALPSRFTQAFQHVLVVVRTEPRGTATQVGIKSIR